MFDIAPSELLVVALVALIFIPPKDLPRAMRFLGRFVGKARGMARQFRGHFDEMVREAELEEMEKKWKEENERIMREHAVDLSLASPVTAPALTAPAPAEAAASDETIHGAATTASSETAVTASPSPLSP